MFSTQKLNLDDLNTGDLLLFNNSNPTGISSILTYLIKYGTHSNYSHVAMVLRDPVFLAPTLKGVFVWESSWEGKPDPQDGLIKLGVQITPIHEIMKDYKDDIVVARKIQNAENIFTPEKLKQIHDVVYDKPYDVCPIDWVEAFLKKDPNPQKTSRFWCSALVGYIYTKCGVLDPNTDWSILAPNDLSLSGETVKFTENCKLSNTEVKLL